MHDVDVAALVEYGMANAENMSPSCDCSVSLSGHSKIER